MPPRAPVDQRKGQREGRRGCVRIVVPLFLVALSPHKIRSLFDFLPLLRPQIQRSPHKEPAAPDPDRPVQKRARQKNFLQKVLIQSSISRTNVSKTMKPTPNDFFLLHPGVCLHDFADLMCWWRPCEWPLCRRRAVHSPSGDIRTHTPTHAHCCCAPVRPQGSAG